VKGHGSSLTDWRSVGRFGAVASALTADFEEGGEEALELARTEDPVRYTAIIASLMSKELAIERNQLCHEELDALFEHVRKPRGKT
jgi:hypothetical protein